MGKCSLFYIAFVKSNIALFGTHQHCAINSAGEEDCLSGEAEVVESLFENSIRACSRIAYLGHCVTFSPGMQSSKRSSPLFSRVVRSWAI